ncbi:MAG: hypothetical protein H6811_03580 [Phycisphaeraceae bacterium]|nr:hypothetical protein [Phycisphaeraceae bacterium]
MKLKGIGALEQNVEKIVLGVVGLVFLLVVAMQFLAKPNTVEIQARGAGKQRLRPDKAFEPIGDMAQGLLTQMRDPRPELPEASQVGLSQAWQSRHGAAFVPTPTIPALAAIDGPGVSIAGDDVAAPIPEGDFRFPQISVPAPSPVMTVAFVNTIDPLVTLRSPEVRNLLPREQPFDKAAVTIEGRFDGVRFKELLTTDPDGDGSDFAAIPMQWWKDSMAVLSVDVERCSGFDAQGNAISPTPVTGIPGRTLPIASLSEETPAVERFQEIVDLSRDEARQVTQPRYLPVIAGTPWLSPTEAARLADIESQRADIDRRVALLERTREEIASLQLQLQELGRGGGGAPPTSRDSPRGNTPRDNPQQTDPGTQPADSNRQRIETIERRIEQLQLDVERARLNLEDLGVDEAGVPLIGRPGGEEEFLDDLLESPDMRLIAHDLSVEPGKTYQYRMRVRVNNPLFGHGQQLPEDQQPLATVAVLTGAWSDWSPPTTVDGAEYYFVTGANQGDDLGGPRASVEMFRFYYGYWRRAVVAAEPGDSLVATVKLPDPALLPIWDLAAVAQRQVAPPTPQPGTNPRDRGDPRGRDSRGLGGPDNPAPTDEQVVTLPEDAAPGPANLVVDPKAVLLDVAAIPGANESGTSRFQAYFRTPAGSIAIRDPMKDGRSAAYARMKASALAGLRQGQPEPVKEEEPAPPPVRRQQDRPTPPPGGGRPGGGGGG